MNSAWPGMGLFGESYILFSIGTLTPLWKIMYPECFEYSTCKPRLLYSLTYSVVAGLIVGMLVIGRCANTIGRRKGSILTAFLMTGAAWCMVLLSFLFALQEAPVTLFRSTAVSLFVFGIGVGGEYPLSCSIAAEKSSAAAASKIDRFCENLDTHHNFGDDKNIPLAESETIESNHRGRQIQLVFAMQGVGIWCNSVTLLILLWIFGQTSPDTYNSETLLTIWRISYMFGASILLVVLLTRYLYLEESKVWEEDRAKKAPAEKAETLAGSCGEDEKDPSRSITEQYNEERFEGSSPELSTQCSTMSQLSNPSVVVSRQLDGNYNTSTLHQHDNQKSYDESTSLWYNYGGRLFGASLAWLLWDISFYGNKLFQATFLLALTGDDTTLLEFAFAATLNSTVALLGYFAAAVLLDEPKLGRVRLQCFGFLLTGFLFVTCGFAYDALPSGWLVALYLASSFIGQVGPNATTFLIPGEIFPTEHRTYCHGICAASGKVGALVAAVLFHFVQQEANLFFACGYTSFAGCFLTYYFVPETLGLDLNEVDKRWHMIRNGREIDYRGPANKAKYLSLFESQRSSFC